MSTGTIAAHELCKQLVIFEFIRHFPSLCSLLEGEAKQGRSDMEEVLFAWFTNVSIFACVCVKYVHEDPFHNACEALSLTPITNSRSHGDNSVRCLVGEGSPPLTRFTATSPHWPTKCCEVCLKVIQLHAHTASPFVNGWCEKHYCCLYICGLLLGYVTIFSPYIASSPMPLAKTSLRTR